MEIKVTVHKTETKYHTPEVGDVYAYFGEHTLLVMDSRPDNYGHYSCVSLKNISGLGSTQKARLDNSRLYRYVGKCEDITVNVRKTT